MKHKFAALEFAQACAVGQLQRAFEDYGPLLLQPVGEAARQPAEVALATQLYHVIGSGLQPELATLIALCGTQVAAVACQPLAAFGDLSPLQLAAACGGDALAQLLRAGAQHGASQLHLADAFRFAVHKNQLDNAQLLLGALDAVGCSWMQWPGGHRQQWLHSAALCGRQSQRPCSGAAGSGGAASSRQLHRQHSPAPGGDVRQCGSRQRAAGGRGAT